MMGPPMISPYGTPLPAMGMGGLPMPPGMGMMPAFPPPPAGRQLRNYADLDAPAEGSFIPNYGLLLTPHEVAVAAGEVPPEKKKDSSRRSRRSPSRSRSRSPKRDSREVSPAKAKVED